MATWFNCKIRYQKENEAGSLVSINEQYLVDAVSYTEAEARLTEIVANSTKDWQLVSITRMKLSEVFIEQNNAESWYKVKVNYTTFNEKTQKEKKVPHFMLINADSPMDAIAFVNKNLGNLYDWEITDANLTQILEVHPWKKEVGNDKS